MDLATDPAWLAEGLTDFGFDRNLYTFARDGFAPFREEYKAACVNLGRRVTFDLPDGNQGAGEAVDVDAEGRLVVRTTPGNSTFSPGKCRCTASTGQYNYKKGQMHNRASAPFIFDDLKCAPQAMTEGVLA